MTEKYLGGGFKRRDFPTLALEKDRNVLDLIRIINDHGGSATREEISNVHNFGFNVGTIIASSKQYGLIERKKGSRNLILTALGKGFCLADDKKPIIINILLNVPYFRRLISEKDFQKFPPLSVLKEIMKGYNLTERDATTVAGVFRRSLSNWSISFKEMREVLLEFSPEKNVSKPYTIFTPKPIADLSKEENLASDVAKLSFTISFLLNPSRSLNKEKILSILDRMSSRAKSFPELKREIESVKKFSNYSQKKPILSYIRDNFENAISKDLKIEKISDIVQTFDKKTKKLEVLTGSDKPS